MFQLIVAVISIALIAALAIASIFYGGDAFTKSSEKANVTTLINQAQQIAGAAALYKTETGSSIAVGVVDSANSLITQDFLAQAPSVGKIATGDWAIASTSASGGKLYAVVEFKDATSATDLCRDDSDAADDVDDRGEVFKQNGLCATVAADVVTTTAPGTAATHFAFPL